MSDAKCSFELLFRDLKRSGPPLTKENEHRLKSQLKHISHSYIYTHEFSNQKQILIKEDWEALKAVVRVLALRSGDPGFRIRSDDPLNVILVVTCSTSQLHL